MAKAVWVTFIVLAVTTLSSAQRQTPSILSGEPNYSVAPDPPALSGAILRQMVLRQAQDRDLALRKDTEKLLELASQLKMNVDRTNPNMLSLDVIKKAQEIEKLAKSVREKMKGD